MAEHRELEQLEPDPTGPVDPEEPTEPFADQQPMTTADPDDAPVAGDWEDEE